MLINIEGTDGCGKKTQVDLLYNYLKSMGKKVLKLSFPNYESESSSLVKMYLRGDFGESVNDVNAYQASVLFSVDRLATMLKIDVNKYDYVLFDRYVPSNMIHQSTRIENIEDLNYYLEWLEDLEYGKLNLPKPDRVLFLDVPVEISMNLARQRKDLKNGQDKDIQEKDDEHLKKAYKRGRFVAQKFGWTIINCEKEGNIKSINEIHEDILTKLGLK